MGKNKNIREIVYINPLAPMQQLAGYLRQPKPLYPNEIIHFETKGEELSFSSHTGNREVVERVCWALGMNIPGPKVRMTRTFVVGKEARYPRAVEGKESARQLNALTVPPSEGLKVAFRLFELERMADRRKKEIRLLIGGEEIARFSEKESIVAGAILDVCQIDYEIKSFR